VKRPEICLQAHEYLEEFVGLLSGRIAHKFNP